MIALQLDNLTRLYGRRVGVKGLTFAVDRGDVFGFLGPNGSGKTTAIRVLLGLLRPTRGRARILDLDCWAEGHRVRSDVGYMPGDLRLYPWMTGRIGLRLVGAARGRDLSVAGMRFAELFDLDMNVRVRKMSRGMRQKLGLIMALASEPKLLILDEPTSALDPIMQDRLCRYLRERASQGCTVFFSSHTLSEVERLCDRVVILREGRVVADETIPALRARARREVTIRWRAGSAAATIAPPEILALTRHSPERWIGTLNASPVKLLEWLAGKPIEDFSIGQPDLESLFRGFYERKGGEP